MKRSFTVYELDGCKRIKFCMKYKCVYVFVGEGFLIRCHTFRSEDGHSMTDETLASLRRTRGRLVSQVHRNKVD